MVGGAVQCEYTYGLQRISQYQLISGFWTSSFYSYDGSGSVTQLTDLSKRVTDTYSYDAFGNPAKFTGSTPNSYLYRGEQYDLNLDLYYLRARYYDPISGRFLSRDPEDGDITLPATLHKYLYAAGDPVNRMDPTGRMVVEDVEIDKDLEKDAPGELEPVEAGIACRLAQAASSLAVISLGLVDHTVVVPIIFPGRCIATGLPVWHYGDTGYGGIPEPQPAPGGGRGYPPPPGLPTEPCSCQPGWHMHHMLPQNAKMKAWFADSPRNLNVEDPRFLVCMPPGAHIGKGGLHPNGWNPEWTWYMDEFPDATAQDVLDQLQRMENEWRFQKPLSSCDK